MKRIANWWFAPAPAERLAALRILIGGYALIYVLVRLPELVAVASYGRGQFTPIGVVRVLDAPLPSSVALALVIVTCGLLVAFVAGFRFRITGPLAAAALLWTITYRNAWGMPFHTENLMVLHVIVLAIVPSADAWAISKSQHTAKAGYGWPIKLLAALTAATYVLAGVAKLRIAGLDWIDGELLRNQIAIDNLRKALLGDFMAPLATLFLDHPKPLVVFCVMTLAVELGAPIALLHRRLGYAWALAAWGFHLGVVLMMNIWFLYPLVGVALLPLFPAERVVRAAIRIARGIATRLNR